jgi:beta-lactamase class A
VANSRSMADLDSGEVGRRLAAAAASLGGTVGVAAQDLNDGRQVMMNATPLFPLASVFKVPVMVTVMRSVDAGELSLDERIVLHEDDKSPGQGGILCYCREGLALTVSDLLYFMITQSDNTATDLLWRRAGLTAVNATMRELGLQGVDCVMPNREFFLIEAGLGREWTGLSGSQIAARWRELAANADARDVVLARVRAEYSHLTGAAFTRIYDERWGYSGELNYDEGFAVDQALDNVGSPRDLAALLGMIAQDRCASPAACQLMVEIMTRQEWRDRIPAGLPEGLRIANKTGGVAGTVNDVAIVYRSDGRAYALAVFCKGLSREQSARAPAAIARIAAIVHEHFHEAA